MYSTVSRLLTGVLKNYWSDFYETEGIVGHDQGTTFISWVTLTKVKVIRGQKVKIVFLRITPFKIVGESLDKKLKCSLFSSLNTSKYDYGRYALTLLVRRQMWRPSCKDWMLVCWWWRFDWNFACLIAPVVTAYYYVTTNCIAVVIPTRARVRTATTQELHQILVLPVNLAGLGTSWWRTSSGSWTC